MAVSSALVRHFDPTCSHQYPTSGLTFLCSGISSFPTANIIVSPGTLMATCKIMGIISLSLPYSSAV